MCVHNRLYTIIGWSRAWMRYLPSWVTFETISCSYIPAKVLVCCVRNMKCYFFTVHCIGRYRGACLYYEISKCPCVWGVDSCKQDVSEQWEEAMVNHIQGIAVWIIMTSLPECYVYRSSHVQCVHTHTHKYTHTHTLFIHVAWRLCSDYSHPGIPYWSISAVGRIRSRPEPSEWGQLHSHCWHSTRPTVYHQMLPTLGETHCSDDCCEERCTWSHQYST